MTELILGIALGAMIATPTGRSIGNQVGDAMAAAIKKAAATAKPPEKGGGAG